VFFQRVFESGPGKLILSLAVAMSAAGNVMVVIFSMVPSSSRSIRRLSVPSETDRSPTDFALLCCFVG